jgi:putative MATE family efflux protein
MTKNLTVGNPALLIVSFALPLLGGNLFQQFYNMADTFIVGRTIGVSALAAVGCTGSIMFLIMGFVMGFTAGVSIIAAQRFGASDSAGVRRSFAVSITLGFVITVVLMTISLSVIRPLLVFLRTPEEIFDDACSYIIPIFSGIIVMVFFNVFSNMLRAVGDSRTPLIFLSIACVINIILDLVFIIVFHAGTAGAGLATVAAQFISVCLCLGFIQKKIPILRLSKEDWRFAKGELWIHLRQALPMGFQMSIIAIGMVVVQFALNGLGTTAVAAYTAAVKVDMVASMPMASFGVAMATYTAQNFGARKYERIKNGCLQCALISGSFSVVIGIIFVFFGRVFVTPFIGSNKGAVELAQTYLMIYGSCYVILSMLFIFRNSLQGLGNSLIPTIGGIMELLMRSFAAIALSVPFGFAGICWASPLAWLGAFVPVIIAFRLTIKKLMRKPLAVKIR